MPAPPVRGFFGKLPARGDFVNRGLPRGFVAPWEDWVSQAILASRDLIGATWLDAWMVAPVWRFSLPGGVCGPDAVLGLTLPSVDRVGRAFPLTVVALYQARMTVPDLELAAPFLDAVEDAARDAIAGDRDPDWLAEAIGAAPAPPDLATEIEARWWTEGGPSVPPQDLFLAGLPPMPDSAAFLAGGDTP